MMRDTELIGTAKPMPRLPACARSLRIAVLMPITSPRTLSSGPPELPGLIAASVWIIGCSRPDTGKNGRPIALITPTVTVCPRLNGLPMAMTQSPGAIWSLSPNFAATSGVEGISVSWMSALSVSGSRPTIFAS